MTLYDLWFHAPQCFVFVRKPDGTVQEYTGAQYGKEFKVDNILATSYPMFKHVLEVTEDRHET